MAEATTPAYKTKAFWLKVAAANIGLFLVSGVALTGTAATIVGWALALLPLFGIKLPEAPAPELPPAPPAE